MIRAFVAVWPSGPLVETLHALDRPELPGVRWTRPEQWHLTLRFLGAIEEDEVDAVASALASALAGVARPPVAIAGPATHCFGRSILVLPVVGLDAVAAATVAATAAFGTPPDPRPFAGHLTLARSRRGGPDLRRLAGRPVTGRWTVAEATLVRSRTDPAGARYDVLGRFPLGHPEHPHPNTRSELR